MRVIQLVPGRIGLRISALKSNRAYAQQVQHTLSDVNGIGEVDINALTGSVLISYDPQSFGQESCQMLLAKLMKLFPNLDFKKLLDSLTKH